MQFNPYQFRDLQSRSKDLYANAKYQFIINYLHQKKNLLILNAGFGSGELSIKLAQMGNTVVNIDPVQEYIDLAKANALVQGLKNISYIKTSIEEYTPTEKYDCVITTDVLEHIENDVLAFNKLAEFLKPAGVLVITVPAEPILFGYHDQVLGHFRRYTVESLLKICPPIIAIDSTRYFGWTVILICLVFSKILKKEYPVTQTGNNKILRFLFQTMLYLDTKVDLEVGTSLIVFGHRKIS